MFQIELINKSGKKFIFNVSDNGPGIPEKYQKQVFEIFQTVPGQNKHDSTGIGFAIVKNIETMNGSIFLKSSEGEGTEFIFTITEKII